MKETEKENFLQKIWRDYISSGLNITQEQAAQRVDGLFLEIRRIMLINIIGLLAILFLIPLIGVTIYRNDQVGTLIQLISLFVMVANIVAIRIAKKPFFSALFLHIGFSLVFAITLYIGSFDAMTLVEYFVFTVISFYIIDRRFSVVWNTIWFFIMAWVVFFSDNTQYRGLPRSFFVEVTGFFVFMLFVNYFHQTIEDRNEMQMEQSKKELANSFNQMVDEIEQRRKLEDKLQSSLDESAISNKQLEETQKAIINVMEDLEHEKSSIEKRQANDEAILTSIGDGLMVTDTKMRITLVNKASTDILGFSKEELLGKTVGEAFKIYDAKGQPVNIEDTLVSQALKKGKILISETRFYENKKGEKVPVKATVTPIILDGRMIGAAEAFRDVTKEIEVDRAKTEFVSLASHQLKTPLSAINWYTELLLSEQGGKLTDEQKDYVGEIHQGSARMNDLVNALLNVSRIDLGTFAVDPELTDIIDLVESVISESQQLINQKKLEIVKNFQEKLPKINVDPRLMRIVIQNLLTNSVKYTPEKGKITIDISVNDKDMVFKVSDTGYGIPKSQQDKIFQKLFRADNVVSKETDGTGLGLYIVKSIIEEATGTIRFESKENKGTTFIVTIPLDGMKKKQGSKPLT